MFRSFTPHTGHETPCHDAVSSARAAEVQQLRATLDTGLTDVNRYARDRDALATHIFWTLRLTHHVSPLGTYLLTFLHLPTHGTRLV